LEATSQLTALQNRIGLISQPITAKRYDEITKAISQLFITQEFQGVDWGGILLATIIDLQQRVRKLTEKVTYLEKIRGE
jgi:hypothetical protein